MSEPTVVEADGGTIHSNSFKEGRLNRSVDVEDEGSFDHDIDLSSSISSATNNNNLRSSDGDYDDDTGSSTSSSTTTAATTSATTESTETTESRLTSTDDARESGKGNPHRHHRRRLRHNHGISLKSPRVAAAPPDPTRDDVIEPAAKKDAFFLAPEYASDSPRTPSPSHFMWRPIKPGYSTPSVESGRIRRSSSKTRSKSTCSSISSSSRERQSGCRGWTETSDSCDAEMSGCRMLSRQYRCSRNRYEKLSWE